MTNEKNALITVLASLWLGFMCSYGIITIGRSWIFTMGLVVGSLMLIVGVFNIVFDNNENED